MHEPETSAEAELVARAEARFDRLRRGLGLALAPVLGVIAFAFGPQGVQGRLAGVMAATAVLWISEAVPVAAAALFAAVAAVVTGVATPKEAFTAFGHPTLFLFVGSFFLAEAMIVHGLGERLAQAAGRIAKTRFSTMVALSGATFALSMWISNAASTAVMLPVALAVGRRTGDRKFSAALVLSIAWGASVGGIGTPIGTPPNLIGLAALRERAHVDLGFAKWMLVGAPMGLAMLAVMWAVLRVQLGVRGQPVEGALATRAASWQRGEVAVATAFGAAVVLWLVPGALELVGPAAWRAAWQKHLPEEVVAVAASLVLFVWPVGTREAPRPALTWAEATRIDWATILLFGAGILLGDLAGKTGLATTWGTALVQATGASSVFGITALVTGASILLSEATSNTATATLMVPLTISVAQAAHVDPLPPALGATFGASFGFMLPISTAPNAMAYGTGQVSVRQMMRAGIVFDLIGFVVISAALAGLLPLLQPSR